MEGTLEGAQRTADIVQGLKRFSAMDRGERIEVDLNGVIERAIHWVRKGTAPSFEVHWSPGPPCTVMGNAGQLLQVVMNLVQNAYDARGHAGERGAGDVDHAAVRGRAPRDCTSATTARASRPSTCRASSTPSSPPSRWARARGWACRSATASSSSTAAG